MENRISITIPEVDLQVMRDALNTIRETMGQYFSSLTPEQRRRLAKMSDGTEPFVEKVMEYSVTDPQFNPPYMDVAELKKDLDAYSQLKPFVTAASQLEDELSDTAMLAGSEAYAAALSYYNSVKMASKLNVNGAKAIYEDLRKRFEHKSKKE